ncbi:MAG: hypothetical protein AB1629_06935 [Candidatus Omnitrophota bacterium]
MLVIEIVGERLYEMLSLKERDASLMSVYQRLALAEHQTAEQIIKEISLISKDNHIVRDKMISKFSKFVLHLFTAKQLAWILRAVLKRRSYSRWFDIYKGNNREFWNLLLAHEQQQVELLRITDY